MTTELTILVLGGLLQVVQFALMAIPANKDLTPGYLMSARDREPSREISVTTGRMQRAFNNNFEALILFGIAAVAISISDQSSWWTGLLAIVFLIARVAYVPAYYLGWNPGRTYIWLAGFGATVLSLLAALF